MSAASGAPHPRGVFTASFTHRGHAVLVAIDSRGDVCGACTVRATDGPTYARAFGTLADRLDRRDPPRPHLTLIRGGLR